MEEREAFASRGQRSGSVAYYSPVRGSSPRLSGRTRVQTSLPCVFGGESQTLVIGDAVLVCYLVSER